jgi:hypothetical protein
MSYELAIAVCEKRVRVHEAPARGRRKPSRFRSVRALGEPRLGREPRTGGDREDTETLEVRRDGHA